MPSVTFVKGNSKREPLVHSIHDEEVANFNVFFWKHASFTFDDTSSGVYGCPGQLHTNPQETGPTCPLDSFEHPSLHSSQLHDTLDEHFRHVEVLPVGSSSHLGREAGSSACFASLLEIASFLHRRHEYPPLWFALMDHMTSCTDPAFHT